MSHSGPGNTEESQEREEDVVYLREKPDGTADPAGEAGWYLERERASRGETLESAGEATGIHPYHLEAIEYGDLTRMPARMEALEMIGCYAQYLGFDPEPLVEHYARFLPRPLVAPKRHPANPAPLTSAKILRFGMPRIPKINFRLDNVPGGAGGIVACIAAAIVLFAGASWMMVPGDGGAPKTEQIAGSADPMPTASTGGNSEVKITEEPMPEDAGSSEAAAVPDDENAGTGLDGLTALIEEQVPAAEKAVKKVVEAAEQIASAGDVAITEDGRLFGARNDDSRLTLKAKAPVWIRVEDAQGNVVMTQMLMKGDTYRVPNREGLVVIARDGGLLSYLIDGKEKGILGTPGEILVGRPLDIKSLDDNS